LREPLRWRVSSAASKLLTNTKEEGGRKKRAQREQGTSTHRRNRKDRWMDENWSGNSFLLSFSSLAKARVN